MRSGSPLPPLAPVGQPWIIETRSTVPGADPGAAAEVAVSNPAQAREAFEARLREFVGKATGPPSWGPQPVNEPMIRHWCEAMGDENPVYRSGPAAEASRHGGAVAPPTMLQAWILSGMPMARPESESGDLQLELHTLLTENGYPSVVATNSEQGYVRYLRPGDRVQATTVIESISGHKATALGTGYFIDTRTVFRDEAEEEVGWMTFRVLKFRPAQPPAAAGGGETAAAPAKPRRLRPVLGHDNQWWWEAVSRGEFLIQKCRGCGVLRHPPRPMCGRCQSTDWETVASRGAGEIASFVVMHHPQVPGYEYPLVCALVDLDEGVRFLSNVVGCRPDAVRIGMRVQATIEAVDEELKLPLFRPAE